MKSAIVVFLICLLVLYGEGQGIKSNKCRCESGGINFVEARLIKSFEKYDPSPFCPQMEIVVTTANNKTCVKPQSILGKILIQRWNRQKRT